MGRAWNASITRSANSPGTSSTTTRSPCTAQPAAQLDGLRVEGADELVEGLGEGGHALLLEHPADVVEVDADVGRAPSSVASRRLGVGVDRAGDGAVVDEGVDRLLRHRVHRVGADERVDVGGVGVRRVLGGGGGPQRALHPSAPGDERLPPRARGTWRGTAGRRPAPGRRRPCPAGPARPRCRSRRGGGRPRCRRGR